jgi:hypothetical protein
MRNISGRIERQGAFAYATVMATSFQVAALKAQGLAYPAPQQIAALIDTGASSSVLDTSVISSFALTLTGQTLIHTPSTGSQYESRNQYAASISLIDPTLDPRQGIEVYNIAVIESHLASEGFLAIIGRDILSRCIFTFDGPAKIYRLEF